MISKKAAALKPYTADSQTHESGFVRLNLNENPYPLVGMPIMDQSDWAKIRLYPEPDSIRLKEVIAGLHKLHVSNIMIGNGIDELLGHAFLALFDPGAKFVYAPDITYSLYNTYADAYNIPYKQIPVSKNFEIKPEDYYFLNNCQGIVLANPNTPTSLCLKTDFFEKMAIAYPDANIIIDETYIDFGGESAIPLLGRYRNIIIMRSLSKAYSLAGMRVGYIVAREEKIKAIENIRSSLNRYSVDKVAQTLALQAISLQTAMKSNLKHIIDSRGRLVSELTRLGFETLPPSANFVFTTHKKIKSRIIFEKLKEQKVLVYYSDKPRTEDYLRISVGSDKDLDALLIALNKIINK